MRKNHQAQLPALQTQIENNQQVLGEDDVPRNMQGQPDALRIWAIEVALSSEEGKNSMIPSLTGCGQRYVMTVLTLTKSWRAAAAAGKTDHRQDRRAAVAGLSGH